MLSAWEVNSQRGEEERALWKVLSGFSGHQGLSMLVKNLTTEPHTNPTGAASLAEMGELLASPRQGEL